MHAPPALKNHRIVAIGDKCPEIASCDTHTDERLKYWCHACDTLVCRDCLLFEHKEHKSALMDQVAKQLKSQVNFRIILGFYYKFLFRLILVCPVFKLYSTVE